MPFLAPAFAIGSRLWGRFWASDRVQAIVPWIIGIGFATLLIFLFLRSYEDKIETRVQDKADAVNVKAAAKVEAHREVVEKRLETKATAAVSRSNVDQARDQARREADLQRVAAVAARADPEIEAGGPLDVLLSNGSR